MKLFWNYLKYYRGVILAWVVFCLIFIVIFLLYQIPVAPALYASAACTLFGGIFLARGFLRFWDRHRWMEELWKQARLSLGELPEASSYIEEDYQELVRILAEEKRNREDELEKRYGDMMAYYTTWVHQIKTPIAAMRLRLAGEDSAASREMTGDLIRIEQYVEMVLCYLRLDANSTDYVLQQCDLDAVVRQAVRKLAPQFIGRKVQLDYSPLACKVLTDEKWLLFVVEQVLSNALKYTPSGGKVTIRREGEKILAIEDTGIGIAPEDLPRIFEQGYTGYNGRRDKKASGIGLYLCRRICRSLGHAIWAESEVDVGTVIRIDLTEREIGVE